MTALCVYVPVYHWCTCVAVFAYGATGAGKTFSMLGTPQTPGVIFLTMMDLYNVKETQRDMKSIDISVSYLEVCIHIRLLLVTAYVGILSDKVSWRFAQIIGIFNDSVLMISFSDFFQACV